MYPLDTVYGPQTYRTFDRDKVFERNLKSTTQSSRQISLDEPLVAKSYTELVEFVSFLSIMNKRHTLYFRGQTKNWPLRPTAFRPIWKSLTGAQHSIPDNRSSLQRIWEHLNGEISTIVLSVCEALPMPRRATLRMFREAVWAVAQHYELWPTPLIDITPNLRIAASFALWGGEEEGCLYVVALPPSTNSVTFDADQHVVLARLQAVCPPVAKRPHYQDGFLVGRFPFLRLDSNDVDKHPSTVSDLSRRLVARIVLRDSDDAAARRDRRPSGKGFWSDDFPRMSVRSLIPDLDDDILLSNFAPHGDQIDAAMNQICHRQ